MTADAPGWLVALQVFEWAGLAVGALLVVTGVAPRLGLAVAAVSLLVAVLTSIHRSRLTGS